MRKLGKLKLTQLNRDELEARQMNALRGGVCGCVCVGCACIYSFQYPGDSYTTYYVGEVSESIVGTDETQGNADYVHK
jgi:natural product precursor